MRLTEHIRHTIKGRRPDTFAMTDMVLMDMKTETAPPAGPASEELEHRFSLEFWCVIPMRPEVPMDVVEERASIMLHRGVYGEVLRELQGLWERSHSGSRSDVQEDILKLIDKVSGLCSPQTSHR